MHSEQEHFLKPTKGAFESKFMKLAKAASRATGQPVTFGVAISAVVIWGVLGPIFGFSDTWQLVINTATTIITFLMVFLIQNTQNRDSASMQIKLDEIIRSQKGAHNALLDLEELSESEIDQFREKYEELASKARKGKRKGAKDVDTPEIEFNDEKKSK